MDQHPSANNIVSTFVASFICFAYQLSSHPAFQVWTGSRPTAAGCTFCVIASPGAYFLEHLGRRIRSRIGQLDRIPEGSARSGDAKMPPPRLTTSQHHRHGGRA